MLFRQITDSKLAQYAYLIGCQRTKEALLIDPERDIDRYLAIAAEEGLTITHVAETHIHADFLSGARGLAEATGARLFLSAEGEEAGWGSFWAKDREDVTFLRDGDTFRVGNIEITAVHSPGHTPEHLSYLVTDHGGGASTPMGIASGDFVFVGDLGRPDLLESAAGQAGAQDPAARALYDSVQRFLDLDDGLQVWPGHGAGSACGKALGAIPQSTVGYERAYNGSIDAARRGQEAFVDAILDAQPEPPLYFGRMKQQNRDGVPPLAALPTPRALSPQELADLAPEAVVIDTRADRSAFMAAHLPGALYSPLGKSFNTVVGSFVTDPATPLVLVAPEARIEEAVRDLVRIGYDNVQGYATYETLQAALDASGGETIPEVTFEDVVSRAPEAAVLDVRRLAEFGAGHVPGATNIAHTRLAGRLGDVPEGSPLYVHCQSGVRAAVAAAFLAREGRDVRYVGDGFPHYREIASGAVETGMPEAQTA
ncbi:MBL fold metallo-hydrolase [Rubricoccus marinus]|uniref:MBL fold metallo-hydrolase n=1 Tax=Rubricoccus marinus TaxID=716817 RepID=A0A259TV56_9BACT|nr:MBL fold metallo-hydrolase [Rubricoccus marinus]OZC01649.1 MBL fold metallo-hydrolase [Rubricoccus marinus]